jgi:hypothetical protein
MSGWSSLDQSADPVAVQQRFADAPHLGAVADQVHLGAAEPQRLARQFVRPSARGNDDLR